MTTTEPAVVDMSSSPLYPAVGGPPRPPAELPPMDYGGGDRPLPSSEAQQSNGNNDSNEEEKDGEGKGKTNFRKPTRKETGAVLWGLCALVPCLFCC